MKYFFTRKLMLIKESRAFVCLPGRLRHAGRDLRAAHAPPDRQGDPGTGRAARRARRHLLDALGRVRRPRAGRPRGSCRPTTTSSTSSPTTSTRRSPRSSGSGTATTRSGGSAIAWWSGCATRPPPTEVADLNERFGDLLLDGTIEVTEPLPAEVADRDELDLPRLVMRYDARRAGRLRGLIDALNDLPSAQPLSAT